VTLSVLMSKPASRRAIASRIKVAVWQQCLAWSAVLRALGCGSHSARCSGSLCSTLVSCRRLLPRSHQSAGS
jgi:hypothetical protein